ncbi:MAG: NADH-quinone oxidoreductase subunit NuoF [Rhodothermales bacterium]|nr:NADH-quinone oxidoreductase subunit NuoF [Rhodothermales bacterium]MBO6779106.1 NADH-quinone oxidoreductase subunit NuoF [Rhodothermales bacterium]
MEANSSKAGDWRNFQRVLLPKIKDLHLLEVYEANGGYKALREILSGDKWDPVGVTNEVKKSGLKGRGGAGFPTGLKWSFMPPVNPDIPRYLCCNGDESEPGTFKDRQLMEYNPHSVFEGMLIASYAMSLAGSYLYIRGEYADWITHMEVELKKLYDKGYVGKNIMGSGFSTELVIHKGAGAYICGEESSLMNSLEGKRAYPRVKPPFPAQKGIWNYPTTINNVETLAAVPYIMERGGDWFASVGAEKHPGPVLYGISGHVNRPGVYEYPTGMLITDLIYEVAGGMRGGKKLKALVPGGSSTPVLRADMIDGVTMDADSLREAGSMMGTSGMLIMDEDTDMVAFLRRITHFYHHESCGQCTPCREGTGWLENIVTRIDEGEGNMRDLDLLLDLCTEMEGRTVCALADAAAWPVRHTVTRFRDEFEAKCKPGHVASGVDLAEVTA